MAPLSFHLIQVKDSDSFLSALRQLPKDSRPLYVGECEHWIHEPVSLSTPALLGAGDIQTRWDYAIIHKVSDTTSLALPSGLENVVAGRWSITAESPDSWLDSYAEAHATRLAAAVPPLPAGWSAEDYSGPDASQPPADLEFSLALNSYPLGSNRTSDSPTVLKDFIRAHGTKPKGTRPIQMLNLQSSNPGQLGLTFAYIQHFGSTPQITQYGGQTQFFGPVVYDWSSRKDEGEQTIAEANVSEKGYDHEGADKVGWENTALVWYPSIWHFGKLLDDPAYVEADRKYNGGALRDGPILCCSEVEVGYEG